MELYDQAAGCMISLLSEDPLVGHRRAVEEGHQSRLSVRWHPKEGDFRGRVAKRGLLQGHQFCEGLDVKEPRLVVMLPRPSRRARLERDRTACGDEAFVFDVMWVFRNDAILPRDE